MRKSITFKPFKFLFEYKINHVIGVLHDIRDGQSILMQQYPIGFPSPPIPQTEHPLPVVIGKSIFGKSIGIGSSLNGSMIGPYLA